MQRLSRLQAAEELAARLRIQEGRNLVAAGVYGSVASGEDRAHSDIDFLVVVRRPRREIGHRMHRGYLVTVLQMTREEAEDEVLGSRSDMEEALGGWRSLRPLYDPAGLLRRLKAHAMRPAASRFRKAARSALLEAYEDYGKLLNAIDAGDRDEMREMAIWFTSAAHMVVFDLAREVLTTGRRAYVELKKHGTLGRDIRSLRYNRHTSAETLRLANRIWNGLLAQARRQGISLPAIGRSDSGGSL